MPTFFFFGKDFGYGMKRAKPKAGGSIVKLGIFENTNAVDLFRRDYLIEDTPCCYSEGIS